MAVTDSIREVMKHKRTSGEANPLTDEVLADGATDAEAGPPDSYMTTDGSAATAAGAATEVADETPPAKLGRALAEQQEKYLRLAAEFDNFRKRSRRERDETWARAQGDLARALLDALDDLTRFAHVDPATTDAAAVVAGVELVERKMMKAFGAAGLEVVNPVGQRFDPALHEAVATEPATSPDEDHIVSRVYQQGYTFGGQLLRPARVVVKQLA